jgi:hypothetical protein
MIKQKVILINNKGKKIFDEIVYGSEPPLHIKNNSGLFQFKTITDYGVSVYQQVDKIG